MSGWLTPGFPQRSVFTGIEQISIDTEVSGGAQPQTAMSTLVSLAIAMKWLNKEQDKTTVAGSRYYTGITLGSDALLTGIETLVGTTGGTDLWIYELHDSTGALVATTSLSGTTAGTASQFQRIAFTAQYQAAAGNYFIAVQSNGTSAKVGSFGSPGLPLVTGSATGTFATGAAITPPTTYTANLGPIGWVY